MFKNEALLTEKNEDLVNKKLFWRYHAVHAYYYAHIYIFYIEQSCLRLVQLHLPYISCVFQGFQSFEKSR